MLLNADSLENRLEIYFPISPDMIVITRGTQEGIIIKFKTFYLKIYNNDDLSFKIQGYIYNKQLPLFEKIIQDNELEKFCAKFTRDDYLRNLQI